MTKKSWTRIWSVFEDHLGEAAPVGVWRRALGTEFDLLTAHVLKREPDQAKTLPCPHPARPGACHVITELGDGTFEATCSHPDGCGTIRASATDLVSWNISATELIRSACKALQITPNVVPVPFLPRAQCLGLFSPHANHQFAAYFLISGTAPELEDSIAQLLAVNQSSIIVILPTEKHVSPRARDLLDRRGRYVTLPQSLTLDGSGHLIPSAAASIWRDAFCEQFVGRLPAKPSMTRCNVPPGAAWRDVTIRFVNGHTVEVSVKTLRQSFNYSQMGMEDRRKHAPNGQWAFLRTLASSQGTMTWKSPKASRRNQKTKENLVKTLKVFFGIRGEPIKNITGGWRTVFTTVPDAVEKSSGEFGES